MYWNVQELASDEGVCAWVTDANGAIQELNTMNWSANNAILTGLYNRSFYQITVANSFIRAATPDAVAAHGITGADADDIQNYVAEARFLRAYQYWVLMDLFAQSAVCYRKRWHWFVFAKTNIPCRIVCLY